MKSYTNFNFEQMVCHVVFCIKILKGEDLPAANLNYEENSFLRYKCSKSNGSRSWL